MAIGLLAACTSAGSPDASVSSPAVASPSAGASAGEPPPCPTSQPEPLPAGETRTVTISTELGQIVIGVEADLSPIATGNFVTLASCGFYDGSPFHRAATMPDGTPFVIQGGDPTGTGTGGPGYNIEDEPVTEQYSRSTVAMARTSQPNSVGSQFFIVLDDLARPPLEAANTYQIIGTVTSGMETADAIYDAADQELPTDPIVMETVKVANP
jgi:peptidyl-prolyl cis-trans isomerase B (cyclophilin B)